MDPNDGGTGAAARQVSAMAAAGVGRQEAFSVGAVLGKTFSVWGRNVLAFGGISLLFQLPVVAVALGLGAPRVGVPDPDAFLRNGLNVLGGILGVAATGALTKGVLGDLRGTPVGFGDLVGFGLRNLWRLIVVSFGVGFFVMLGMLLLIVPGVIVAVMLSVAVPAAVAEPALSHGDALRRSRALTKGYRLPLFLVLLVAYLVVAVAVIPFSIAALFVPALQGGPVYGLVVAGSAILGSLFATSQAVAYHDLRVAKEGVDTAALAAVFD